jgi:alkylhydroperoxidase family enzyme
VTEPLEQLRVTAASFAQAPAAMGSYLKKVETCAYTVTDADVDALKAAGLSEDEIFEYTVATAVNEGLRRLDIGLQAIG